MIKIRQKFVKKRITESLKFKILAIYPISLLLLALVTTPPTSIISGYQKILFSNDLLITDYFGVANLGATLFNAGILGILALLLIKLEHTRLTGINVAAVFTVIGFAMFGKNILNVLPIILGVKLYAYYQQEPFNKFVVIALFSTALAPLVSQSAYIFGASPS